MTASIFWPISLLSLPGASLVPRNLSKWFFPASLCLAGCPIDPFLPPCASQESFPAFVVPSKLSKWSFPASLVPLRLSPIDPFLPPWCRPLSPFLPPWCLSGCPNGLFLPPWCLSGCPNGPFLPPWCLPEQHFTGQSVLRAAGRGAHPKIYREPGRSALKLY